MATMADTHRSVAAGGVAGGVAGRAFASSSSEGPFGQHFRFEPRALLPSDSAPPAPPAHVDFRALLRLDLAAIRESGDVAALQPLLSSIAFSPLPPSLVSTLSDAAVSQLVGFMQLALEYMSHVQTSLAAHAERLERDGQAAGDSLRVRDAQVASLRSELAALKRALRTCEAALGHATSAAGGFGSGTGATAAASSSSSSVPLTATAALVELGGTGGGGERTTVGPAVIFKCRHCTKAFLTAAFLQGHAQRRHPDAEGGAGLATATVAGLEDVRASSSSSSAPHLLLSELRGELALLREQLALAEERSARSVPSSSSATSGGDASAAALRSELASVRASLERQSQAVAERDRRIEELVAENARVSEGLGEKMERLEEALVVQLTAATATAASAAASPASPRSKSAHHHPKGSASSTRHASRTPGAAESSSSSSSSSSAAKTPASGGGADAGGSPHTVERAVASAKRQTRSRVAATVRSPRLVLADASANHSEPQPTLLSSPSVKPVEAAPAPPAERATPAAAVVVAPASNPAPGPAPAAAPSAPAPSALSTPAKAPLNPTQGALLLVTPSSPSLWAPGQPFRLSHEWQRVPTPTPEEAGFVRGHGYKSLSEKAATPYPSTLPKAWADVLPAETVVSDTNPARVRIPYEWHLELHVPHDARTKDSIARYRAMARGGAPLPDGLDKEFTAEVALLVGKGVTVQEIEDTLEEVLLIGAAHFCLVRWEGSPPNDFVDAEGGGVLDSDATLEEVEAFVHRPKVHITLLDEAAAEGAAVSVAAPAAAAKKSSSSAAVTAPVPSSSAAAAAGPAVEPVSAAPKPATTAPAPLALAVPLPAPIAAPVPAPVPVAAGAAAAAAAIPSPPSSSTPVPPPAAAGGRPAASHNRSLSAPASSTREQRVADIRTAIEISMRTVFGAFLAPRLGSGGGGIAPGGPPHIEVPAAHVQRAATLEDGEVDVDDGTAAGTAAPSSSSSARPHVRVRDGEEGDDAASGDAGASPSSLSAPLSATTTISGGGVLSPLNESAIAAADRYEAAAAEAEADAGDVSTSAGPGASEAHYPAAPSAASASVAMSPGQASTYDAQSVISPLSDVSATFLAASEGGAGTRLVGPLPVVIDDSHTGVGGDDDDEDGDVISDVTGALSAGNDTTAKSLAQPTETSAGSGGSGGARGASSSLPSAAAADGYAEDSFDDAAAAETSGASGGAGAAGAAAGAPQAASPPSAHADDDDDEDALESSYARMVRESRAAGGGARAGGVEGDDSFDDVSGEGDSSSLVLRAASGAAAGATRLSSDSLALSGSLGGTAGARTQDLADADGSVNLSTTVVTAVAAPVAAVVAVAASERPNEAPLTRQYAVAEDAIEEEVIE
jgi:hypothetical protein